MGCGDVEKELLINGLAWMTNLDGAKLGKLSACPADKTKGNLICEEFLNKYMTCKDQFVVT